jgi:hypothetical protein
VRSPGSDHRDVLPAHEARGYTQLPGGQSQEVGLREAVTTALRDALGGVVCAVESIGQIADRLEARHDGRALRAARRRPLDEIRDSGHDKKTFDVIIGTMLIFSFLASG